MKIIHCGDVHLDSPMKANLTGEKALERKHELLLTFTGIVEYADKNGVRVLLIAGDLFDSKTVSATTKNTVLNCILRHPHIDFLYLRGNHDTDSFLNGLEAVPENLKLFSDQWTSYRYDNVVITGLELGETNKNTLYNALVLEKNDVNIVLLHGQENAYAVKDNAEIINVSALKHKNIDYLALGHIHTHKLARLDQRGQYGYCGCPEGRGFDECGPKGFVLLEAANGSLSPTFVPFAKRTLHEIAVDITGLETTNEVDSAIQQALAAISREDLVKVVLTGKVTVGAERNGNFLTQKYSERFYAFKIDDRSGLALNVEDYRYDASLKGEFIRLVYAQNYSEQEQREIIETGLKALAREEID